MTKLSLPSGLDSNFRSGNISHHKSKYNLVRVMEYRAFSDSLIKSAYRDSTLTFGFILPYSALVAIAHESKMRFGTDSLQCSIYYVGISIYKEQAQSSILLDIISPPDEQASYYDRYQKTNTPYMRMVTGTIQYPLLEDEVRFYFEHASAKKNFDSAHIKGYIKAGNDSFFIQPLFKAIPTLAKKPMQVLQGYSLMKGDTLYAFMQHAPMVKFLFKGRLKDVLFLNSKTSPAEQMLIAAYFSLVSRLVLTTSTEALY